MKKSVLLGLMILLTLKSLNSFSRFNTFPASGNVGIGTPTPVSPLTIQGSYSSQQSLISYDRSNGIFFNTQGGSTHPKWLVGQQRATTGLELTPSATSGGTTLSIPTMVLKADDNVGIGTTNPQNKLDVNGTKHTEEFKVLLNEWPDFVFDEVYKLLPLSDVENCIKANKKLPTIPSSDEVSANGVNLGELQTSLFQKIEELTLSVIEQNGRIELLEQTIENHQVNFSNQKRRETSLNYSKSPKSGIHIHKSNQS